MLWIQQASICHYLFLTRGQSDRVIWRRASLSTPACHGQGKELLMECLRVTVQLEGAGKIMLFNNIRFCRYHGFWECWLHACAAVPQNAPISLKSTVPCCSILFLLWYWAQVRTPVMSLHRIPSSCPRPPDGPGVRFKCWRHHDKILSRFQSCHFECAVVWHERLKLSKWLEPRYGKVTIDESDP